MTWGEKKQIIVDEKSGVQRRPVREKIRSSSKHQKNLSLKNNFKRRLHHSRSNVGNISVFRHQYHIPLTEGATS